MTSAELLQGDPLHVLDGDLDIRLQSRGVMVREHDLIRQVIAVAQVERRCEVSQHPFSFTKCFNSRNDAKCRFSAPESRRHDRRIPTVRGTFNVDQNVFVMSDLA